MSEKRVYTFGNGKAEGRSGMRNLLGGKGANLAEMNLIGVPVPPGFTITTDVCNEFFEKGKEKVVELLTREVTDSVRHIEILLSGKTFLGLSVLVKIDLNLLFLRIIGYFRSFLVKISAFYNAYSLKLKTKPQDE